MVSYNSFKKRKHTFRYQLSSVGNNGTALGRPSRGAQIRYDQFSTLYMQNLTIRT